jgi:hypothetical protein
MFSEYERAEIRMLFYRELIEVHKAMMKAGSYHYLCLVNGHPMYAHAPIGEVIWHRPWI